MITAKIIDNIWATKKADALRGYKLMLVEVIGGKENGRRIVVVDNISGGVEDRVIVATGSSARKMLGDDSIPVDAAVIGIIDDDCNVEK